ncbi:hypothetical protein M2163_000935 [Streptomyces sp. SAI-135]|jgi:hypothetical protein|nr:hypothetical protein [Streptomyces sp. SAI-090]MDH6554177.1 hypothetical protein [Streptomyces sp. SAI-041]MDH6573439.1 hypothetical protein [Streptomyces sp. SAI-117]MDH6613827.1 hypothetical protein [Streptomyces sp. SAI-135]
MHARRCLGPSRSGASPVPRRTRHVAAEGSSRTTACAATPGTPSVEATSVLPCRRQLARRGDLNKGRCPRGRRWRRHPCGRDQRQRCWPVEHCATCRHRGSAARGHVLRVRRSHTRGGLQPGRPAVATVGSEGTAQLWDVHEPFYPRLLIRFTDHRDAATSVAFAPDGRTIATASDGGGARGVGGRGVHPRPALADTHTGVQRARSGRPDAAGRALGRDTAHGPPGGCGPSTPRTSPRPRSAVTYVCWPPAPGRELSGSGTSPPAKAGVSLHPHRPQPRRLIHLVLGGHSWALRVDTHEQS